MESGTPHLIEIDPAAAAQGTVRQLWLPGDGRVINVRIPPGVGDGALLRVPSVDGAAEVFVRVRVVDRAAVAGGWMAAPAAGWAGGPASPPPRRSRRGLWIAVGVLAVLALLGGGILVAGGDDEPQARQIGSSSSPSPTAGTGPGSGSTSASPTTSPTPTTAPGVSPAVYQRELTRLDSELTHWFQALDKTTNSKSAAVATRNVLNTLSLRITGLARLDPPARVASAHRALLAALNSLGSDLDSAHSDADDGTVCAGSSASAHISRTAGVRQVRAAAARLARADPRHRYVVGRFLPRTTGDLHRRLGNGAQIRHDTSGPGHLKIDNGTGDDTVVSLVKVGRKVASVTVYSRARASYEVTGIADGTYNVFMSSGEDWDGGLRTFTRGCTYQRFDETFPYTTTSSTSTIWSITLQPVIGGNATTSTVDPGSFPSN